MNTLDSLLLQFYNEHSSEQFATVMKVDVEGYEANVLRGAEVILKSGRVLGIVMEFVPTLIRGHGDDPLALLQFLLVDCGFALFCMGVFGCSMEPKHSSGDSHAVRIGSSDLINFVRAMEFDGADLLFVHESWISSDYVENALETLPTYALLMYGSK